MTVNPLVVGKLDQPVDAWAGVWIAEDIELIGQGVKSGSWVDTGLGVVGAALDGLALISDPVGALLQYGVAWLIEHVKPLSQALDWLAGDPGQIAGNAQTWRNVAASLGTQAADLASAARLDLSEWSGAAASAYQVWSGQQQDAIGGLAKGAEVMAAITEGAGFLISAVRALVRDAIATVVSRLIVYAAEEVGTLGFGTPLVVEQVSTLVASWAAKISRWLRGLLSSLRELASRSRQLEKLIELLKRVLNKLRGKHEPENRWPGTNPSKRPNPDAKPGGKRTDAHPTKKLDRPLRRENESADVLAQNGYDVEQNPGTKPNGTNPDYKIEGQYFDCYSPDTSNLDNLRNTMSKKVKRDQADRLVLNLDDCPLTPADIEDVLRRKPIQNLQEVLLVQGGKVIPFFPFP
ncbi:hypothetical protein ACFFWC_28055 [Plantactinospora siamensis]|uniref:tRNA nuclease CdiA C-terminal domain-containing protein n=1 Tax=Plantactinospora siamensis TaxID=555372 RepID=A0ABV6NQ66_9ACTN